jgi:2-polyprenyl-3-methyl-5-hydroxy-6-metoxy-1,4-benzoquinol methylase
VGSFRGGEQPWIERLGSLRNTVRQALISRQLANHVRQGVSVLDAGCGQGTQAVQLAMLGCAVTGVDPSPDLLTLARAGATQSGVLVELLQGGLDDLHALLGSRQFDVVCAHGLLMYLDDAVAGVETLAGRVGDRGLLSLTFRNLDALAFRPGMRRDWPAALQAFDTSQYVNELGVLATAHRLSDLTTQTHRLGFDVEAWYGVRVFTDPCEADEPLPNSNLEALLEAEWLASSRDPYRALGAQIHLLARRR